MAYTTVINAYLACCHVYVVLIVQDDGMTLHCLLSFLHYDAGSLCRSFVTTETVSLLGKDLSAWTLGVSNING